MAEFSPRRRQEILDALKRGTVPRRSLDAFAVGLEPFEAALDEELEKVANGGGVFKAIRGEYGAGKTFFVRWLQERAKRSSFAVAEVQISETETPLHRLETVYRRAMERLSTAETLDGAFRSVIDSWFYSLEEDVLAEGKISEHDEAELLQATEKLLEQRLSHISQVTPQFQLALRAYRRAMQEGDRATADGLVAWLAGQPHVGAAVKRAAGVKGDIDHFGALSFLQGLLSILRDSGYAGLVLVLDEVETLQRVRGDVREKGLNALRQLIDEIDGGRFPGLYLAITGTPAFYEGTQGIQRLEPLAQLLHVDFTADRRFDNPKAVQIRLPGFDAEKLEKVGRGVRDLFGQQSKVSDRVHGKVDDAYVRDLAEAVTGKLGGKVGVSPRIFLKKLVDVMDRVELYEEFNPRTDYPVEVAASELTATEKNAQSAADIDLEMP